LETKAESGTDNGPQAEHPLLRVCSIPSTLRTPHQPIPTPYIKGCKFSSGWL